MLTESVNNNKSSELQLVERFPSFRLRLLSRGKDLGPVQAPGLLLQRCRVGQKTAREDLQELLKADAASPCLDEQMESEPIPQSRADASYLQDHCRGELSPVVCSSVSLSVLTSALSPCWCGQAGLPGGLLCCQPLPMSPLVSGFPPWWTLVFQSLHPRGLASPLSGFSTIILTSALPV